MAGKPQLCEHGFLGKSKCKECIAIRDKAYREKNPEKIRERDIKWGKSEKAKAKRVANPAQYRQADNERRLADPGKAHYKDWTLSIRKLYGISPEEYDMMWLAQCGSCKICGALFTHPSLGKTKQSAHVDHCHTTQKVRALLCSPCNKGIGWLKDSVPRMESAIRYLSTYAPQKSRSEFFYCLPPMNQSERIMIQWAYAMSKNYHRGQVRDGGMRYFEHAKAVAMVLIEHGYISYDHIIMALLHDAFEDTYISMSMVEKLFGPEIARGILSVSKSCGVEHPLTGCIHRLPSLTKEEYFDQIKQFGRRAAVVKCADRIHNLSDLVGDQPEGSRWTPAKRLAQVQETREWILPLAEMYEPRFAEKLRHLCELIEANVRAA